MLISILHPVIKLEVPIHYNWSPKSKKPKKIVKKVKIEVIPYDKSQTSKTTKGQS